MEYYQTSFFWFVMIHLGVIYIALTIPDLIIKIKNKEFSAKDIEDLLDDIDIEDLNADSVNKNFNNLLKNISQSDQISLVEEKNEITGTTEKLFPSSEQIIEKFKSNTTGIFVINAEYEDFAKIDLKNFANERRIYIPSAIQLKKKMIQEIKPKRAIANGESFKILNENSREGKILKEKEKLEKIVEERKRLEENQKKIAKSKKTQTIENKKKVSEKIEPITIKTKDIQQEIQKIDSERQKRLEELKLKYER